MYDTPQTLKRYIRGFNINAIDTKSKKGVVYYNIPCTFDIETTSCYKDIDTGKIIPANTIANLKEKDGRNFESERYKPLAFMYIWQLDIDDHIIIGRTWDELTTTMNEVIKLFSLCNERRIIIYVRNLSFEFQFIRKHFIFQDVFATEERKPIYAVTNTGIEFRCSYFLSGCSLEQTGKNLVKYKASKMVGDLDYSKIRTHMTPLTDVEIGYCIYDVIVDNHYIRECIEMENNNILKIPYTKTGYVRRDVKKHCFSEFNRAKYKPIIDMFKFKRIKDYLQLRSLFSGGFTHANALNSGLIFDNVVSKDFTSSYPAALLLERYPMGKAEEVTITTLKEFHHNLECYACVFDIEITNIREKMGVYENIISKSKCLSLEAPFEENNGRIVRAKSLSLTLNEIDYKCITNFYDFDDIKVINFKRYKKGYLPKPLVECALKFYKEKTILKDVTGKEIEYNLAKSNLNSIYGMMVTDPIRDNILYNNDNWGTKKPSPKEAIEQYNNSKSRFIAYEWGVWITSYARRNLYTGILELGCDYIYSDTDSVKYINEAKHQKYFDNYNKQIIQKIKDVCKYHNLNFDDFAPKTIKGKIKTIGVWDDDGTYSHFKTLGAKRYMVQDAQTGNVNITVSGINKKKAVPYILQESKKKNISPFEYFNNDMYIPCDYCGKMTHKYIDEEVTEVVTDYLGNTCTIHELSSVHLENAPYSLSLAQPYIDFLNKVQEKEEV